MNESRRTSRPLLRLLAILATGAAPLAAADLSVDFAAHADPPLVKKMSIMNSGLVNRDQYDRDLGSFGQLKPEAFRIDMSIGKDNCPMWDQLAGPKHAVGVPGDGRLIYDWGNADWLKARFDEQDILPYWGVSYVPYPLQLGDARSEGLDWGFVDNEDGAFRWDLWRQLGRDFTDHFRAGGRTGYYEIYNEGDLQLEWSNDPAQAHGGQPLRLPVQFVNGQNTDDDHRKAVMTKLHVQMALGMRDGDPDAMVGGPAYSGAHIFPGSSYPGTFLDGIQAAGAPLDFFSYHSISIDTPRLTSVDRTNVMRAALAGRPAFRATELHLTEYFSYAPLNVKPPDQETDPFWHQLGVDGYVRLSPLNPFGLRQPGPITNPPAVADPNSSDLGVHFLDDMAFFLGSTDLTQIAWAFGMDPLPQAFDPADPNNQDPLKKPDSFIGLVATQDTLDAQELRRRKAFTAFAIYGDLPLQRAALAGTGGGNTGIQGLAGVAADQAGVVLWNMDYSVPQSAHVVIGNLPFDGADFAVFTVDGDNAGNGHNPHGLNPDSVVHVGGRAQTWDGTIPPRGIVYLRWSTAPAPVAAPAAQFVRAHHDFSTHDADNTTFNEFDRRTWTAYLGTGANPKTDFTAVGATVRGLAAALRVDIAGEGPLPSAASGGAFGLRIDYHTGAGYVHSEFFDNGARDPWAPAWASQQNWDHDVVVPDIAHFTVDVASFAPAGWDGQAVLTPVMWKAGAGARAAFTFRAGDGSAGGLAGAPAGATITAASGRGTGLDGAYYLGQDFVLEQQVMDRLDPVVDFDWNLSAPVPTMPRTGFCVRWTGSIEAPADGDFTLIARTDDGVRLTFAGALVIDHWVTQGPTDTTFVARGLRAGQRYPVQLDYYQGAGGAEAHLLWSGPGTPRQAIPRSRLYPAAAATPPATVAQGDLVAWYRFADAHLGKDSSGHGNDALSVSGVVATSADSDHPHAVHLGVGSDFTIPVAARDDFTLSLWVRTTAVGGDNGQWWSGLGLLDADLPGTASDFGLSLTGDRASFGAGAADTTVSSTTAINDGRWHLVTAVRSAGGQLQILVDGVVQGAVAGPAGARSAPLSITVGASHDGGGVFVGDVDDIRIYGRTLTTTEVQSVVTSTPGGTVGTGGGGGGSGGTTGGGTTTVTGSNASGCGQGGGFAVLVLMALSLAGVRRRR